MHPVTHKPTKAIFIPDLKQGYWSGEVGTSQSIVDDTIVDSDESALRKNQLSLACNK